MNERIASRCVCCGSADLSRSPAILMPFVASRAFNWTPVEITPEWGLRTIRTGMAYPLCNSLQCQACGLLFLDLRFSEAEMAALYSGYRGEKYAALRESFEPGYAKLNAEILVYPYDTSEVEAFLASHVVSSPRVLDWGGDTGANTPFRNTAAGVDIFDISDRPLTRGARRVGLGELQGAHYDLVVMSHILEHISEPAGPLQAVTGMLDETSVVYIEVPYEGLVAEAAASRELAPKKKYWHEHINFFTEEAVRKLIAGCGLEVIELHIRPIFSLSSITQVLSVVCRLPLGVVKP